MEIKLQFIVSLLVAAFAAMPVYAQTPPPPSTLTGAEIVTCVQNGSPRGCTVSGIQKSGTQTANTVLAAPNGSAGTPTFRALAPVDHAAGAAIAAGNVVSWNSDVGLSRTAAGTLGVGNGTAGNSTGSLSLNNLTASGAITPGTIVFPAWPIIQTSPTSTFVYATAEGTSAPPPFNSPFQDNLAIGDHTLNPITHSAASCSVVSVALFCGDEVAYGDGTLANDTAGRDNTAIGDHALANLTTGPQNTFVGSSAGANVTTAGTLTGIGVSACQNVTATAGPLECVGGSALQAAGSTSQYSSAFGFQSFFAATEAKFSVGLGAGAAYSAATVDYSLIAGFDACANPTSLVGVICIGYQAGPAASTPITNTLWVGGTTPYIYANSTTGQTAFNTASPVSGYALTLTGGLYMPAGSVLGWNSDTGFSRTNAATVTLGNGTQGGATGTLVLAGLNFQYNANFSQITTGQMQLGTGTTVGHGGSLYLTNLTAYGFVREGQTTFANLSTIDPTPQVGDHLVITDASACTANTAVTAGGGSAHSCAVVYNGANWVALVTH